MLCGTKWVLINKGKLDTEDSQPREMHEIQMAADRVRTAYKEDWARELSM